MFGSFDKVMFYGEKYAVVQYLENKKNYVMRLERVEFSPETAIKDEPMFRYFVSVAKSRIEKADVRDKPIAQNLLRQLEKVPPHANTALRAYCSGQNRQRKSAENFIYSFGANESQLRAAEQAFTSQISLIEGPPGTGKTPLGVIEVDGGYHDKQPQIERDALKNSILEKSRIPLLRLWTIEGHIERRILEFLSQWASNVSTA